MAIIIPVCMHVHRAKPFSNHKETNLQRNWLDYWQVSIQDHCFLAFWPCTQHLAFLLSYPSSNYSSNYSKNSVPIAWGKQLKSAKAQLEHISWTTSSLKFMTKQNKTQTRCSNTTTKWHWFVFISKQTPVSSLRTKHRKIQHLKTRKG